MSAFMLNLTDTSGKRMQLPLSNNDKDDRLTAKPSSVLKDGKYLQSSAPKVSGLMSWDRDSWLLVGD